MLHLEDLTFGFRHRQLFAGLSASAKPGEMLHIKGPNGAGKSTLMSLIAGNLAPTKGDITFHHNNAPVDDRRLWVEYLPAEANGLFQKLGALDNLKFWCGLRGHEPSLDECVGALRTWDLDSPLIRNAFPIDKFSTGMKRRLALARLMLSPAPCWLLDEPFYGLDEKAIGIFRQEMEKHLAKEGIIVIVSHDLAPINEMIHHTLRLGGQDA